MKRIGYLGSDVSKGYCDFCLLDSSGNSLESDFQLDDTKQGHDELIAFLNQVLKRHNLSSLLIGVESTGGYENNWYRKLRSHSKSIAVNVVRINPKRIYHAQKSQGVRSITDGVSARNIAMYMLKNDTSCMEMNRQQMINDDLQGHRTLYALIQRMKKQCTEYKNALENILYMSMPGILSIKPEKYANWYVQLLQKYPSIWSIQRAGIERLIKLKGIGRQKAESIIEACNNSSTYETDPASELSIKMYAQQIQNFQAKERQLENQLVKLLRKTHKEQIELLCSIKGVSETTAVAVLLEIQNIERFAEARNLVAFWGIHPTIKQSGDKTYYKGMSKDGSPAARAAIYMAAKNVALHEPYFTSIYRKHRYQKGKAYNVAIGAIMSKLTRVMYGMLKSRKPFDAGVDQLNAAKKPKDDHKGQTMENEQLKNPKSPISRKERNKRKQAIKSKLECI